MKLRLNAIKISLIFLSGLPIVLGALAVWSYFGAPAHVAVVTDFIDSQHPEREGSVVGTYSDLESSPLLYRVLIYLCVPLVVAFAIGIALLCIAVIKGIRRRSRRAVPTI